MYFSKETEGFYSTQIHGDNIPSDVVKITMQEHEALLAAQSQGKVIKWDAQEQKPIAVYPPLPTKDQIMALYIAHIQKRLDDFARTRGYDGVLSCCTYATSTVAKFKAEGQYMVDARDQTWSSAYQIFGDVEAGVRPVPALDALDAELPDLSWPA